MHSVKYSNIKDPKSRENIVKMMVMLTKEKDTFLIGMFKDLFALSDEEEVIAAMFLEAIENNDLEMIQTVSETMINELHVSVNNECIQAVMRSGNVEIAKWLRNQHKVDIFDKDIETCVANDNVELFAYLYGCGEIDYDRLMASALLAIKVKSFEILRVIQEKTIYKPLVTYLKKAVEVDLETVKAVHHIFGHEHEDNNEWESNAMFKACEDGKNDILEWLVMTFWISKNVFEKCIELLIQHKNAEGIQKLANCRLNMENHIFNDSKMSKFPDLAIYREHYKKRKIICTTFI